MTSCRDCKHWGLETYKFRDLATRRNDCTEHRECVLVALRAREDGRPDAKAFIEEPTGYHSVDLWTAPDFGCALGEPR